jgi:hypothetical protein
MKTLQIQFYQADMSKKGVSSCSSCDTLQQKLDQAIRAVEPLLADLGVEIRKEIITIQTEIEAKTHQIVASPTIRIAGFDLFPEHPNPESEERIWSWKGSSFSEPTREVLVESILRGFLGEIHQAKKAEISPYVMQFFDKQTETVNAVGCCS